MEDEQVSLPFISIRSVLREFYANPIKCSLLLYG